MYSVLMRQQTEPRLCPGRPDCRLCGFYGFVGLWLCCTLKAALTDVPVLSVLDGAPAGSWDCHSSERLVVRFRAMAVGGWMDRWQPEEMLLRRKVSSRLEVTGSQTSGCHGDVSSDSLSVGRAGAGAGSGAAAGVSGSWPGVDSWASVGVQEEVYEGTSPVSKGPGEVASDLQTQSWSPVGPGGWGIPCSTPTPAHVVWP